ncbi:MAG: hypothetical protein LBH52_03350 [Puniceicoccales bacterium]|jgi:hypothetical protein|nr:hypothetical protein [Puniceicoccales bacterium]
MWTKTVIGDDPIAKGLAFLGDIGISAESQQSQGTDTTGNLKTSYDVVCKSQDLKDIWEWFPNTSCNPKKYQGLT